MPEKIYSFICRRCARPFNTANPRQKACNKPDCSDLGKRNRRRARKYQKDYQSNRKVILANRYARREARAMMILEIEVPCAYCGVPHQIKQLGVHHEDGNPFNNEKSNRKWACDPCHAKIDRERREQEKAEDSAAVVREI